MKKLFTILCAALMSASLFAGEVATPVISGDLEFTDSVTITISCSTPEADIYYTIDGVTDPKCDCNAAPEYKKPIVIKETTTIKAAAYTGNDWSAVAEKTFTKKAPEPEPTDPNREYLSLDPSAWGWGYNSVSEAVAGGIKTTIISDWGALSMGWAPARDLSEWDKIVIEVSHMDGCDGQWFKLKAYLRDTTKSEVNQMEGLLGLDAPDNEKNYLVIDLHQQKACDISQAHILAVQCEPTGGIFTISSVYLLKESEPEPETLFEMSYEDKWLNIAPADTVTPYFLWLDSKSFYDGKYTEYTQEKMGGYMDYLVNLVNGLNMTDLFLLSNNQSIAPNALLASQGTSPYSLNDECIAFVFQYDTTNKKRASDVEYFVFTYAGEPEQKEGIDEVQSDKVQSTKVLRNGMLLIVRDGKLFNLQGAQIK